MERKTTIQGNRPNKLEGNDESENIVSDAAPAMSSTGYDASRESVKSAGGKPDSMNEEINSLKTDLLSLKQSLANLTSKAASNTIGMATDATSKVSDSVTGAASLIADKSTDMATAVSKGARSLSVEVEEMTRRNPLPALAGAVVVGMLIGMASRGRS